MIDSFEKQIKRALLSVDSPAPTVTYIPTLMPTLRPTPLPSTSFGFLILWICIMFIFASIAAAIYKCLVGGDQEMDDAQRRHEERRRIAQSNGLQVDGAAAAEKFMDAIPVKKYCDTVAYQTSIAVQQELKIAKEKQAKIIIEENKCKDEVKTSSQASQIKGIYDGPLSPAARLRAVASLGGGVDDVAVGMGDEEELCSICLGEFDPDDNVKELNCLHVFHDECLDQWLRRSILCPLCKRKAIAPLRKKSLKPAVKKSKRANNVNRALNFEESSDELTVLYGDGQRVDEFSEPSTPSTVYSRMFNTPGSYPTLFTPARWQIFTPSSNTRQQPSAGGDGLVPSSSAPSSVIGPSIPEEDPDQLTPSPTLTSIQIDRHGDSAMAPRRLSLDAVVESVETVGSEHGEDVDIDSADNLWQVLEAVDQGTEGIDEDAVATTLPSTPPPRPPTVSQSAPTTPIRQVTSGNEGEEDIETGSMNTGVISSSAQNTPTRPSTRRGGNRRGAARSRSSNNVGGGATSRTAPPRRNSNRAANRPTTASSQRGPGVRPTSSRPTTNATRSTSRAAVTRMASRDSA